MNKQIPNSGVRPISVECAVRRRELTRGEEYRKSLISIMPYHNQSTLSPQALFFEMSGGELPWPWEEHHDESSGKSASIYYGSAISGDGSMT